MWQFESSKRFQSYHPENELIFCHQLVITALKIKRKKIGQRSQPPKGTSTKPKRCVWQYESSKRFQSYHPENELIFCHQLVITALKIKRKKIGQRSQPPKGTSTPPEGCVCAV